MDIRAAWPAASEPTLVARDFDREPSRYALTPDSKFVYLLAPEAGKENLYRVAADGGKPAQVLEPATGGYTSLQIPDKAAKTILVAGYGSSVSPTEIVRIDPAAKRHDNLTRINVAEAETIDWAPPLHFWFTSAKGRPIHNMMGSSFVGSRV